jgi:ketosteroid isomerase-like protein
VLLVLAFATLFAIGACGSPPPDEQRIRERLKAMADALAERDTGAVLAPLADDFIGRSGRFDRRAARLLLMREFNAYERLRARLHGLTIEPQGADRATANFRVILTGGSGLIPSSGRWYEVTTGWRREGSDWLLISASWDSVVGP